ncbi:hypothetical protein, partial [Halovibrio sp. HP20-50]|uniref:hypothetical protein n=1 Tax=Halovibrio sp. HP20-59 TaxID=3080275 RepID=UPI00294AF934
MSSRAKRGDLGFGCFVIASKAWRSRGCLPPLVQIAASLRSSQGHVVGHGERLCSCHRERSVAISGLDSVIAS